MVAEEMPDPIGTEFGMTADEISFGQDIKTAMENLYRRVGQEDLQFLIVAVNVQTQTGGNLAEILLRLSRLVRSRAKVATPPMLTVTRILPAAVVVGSAAMTSRSRSATPSACSGAVSGRMTANSSPPIRPR